jgi:putative phage-type endonuclease
MPKIIHFGDDAEWLNLRRTRINSTDSPAVLGISPYRTAYELWHVKAGLLQDTFEDNARIAWGRRLEPVIAAGVCEDHGLELVRPLKVYMLDDEIDGMGSSFDFEVRDPSNPDAGPGLLEVKNVDGLVFRQSWQTIDGEPEAPPHIECQLQHQLAVSGYRWAVIGALVGGNTSHLIRRERDEEFIRFLRGQVRDFLASIDAKTPPGPDYRRDLDSIKELYKQSDPAARLTPEQEARLAEIVVRYDAARAAAKAADEAQKAIQAELLHVLGPVEEARLGDWKVSAKTSQRKGYVVEPTTTRRLDVRRSATAKAA